MKNLFMGVLLALTTVVSVAKPIAFTDVNVGRVTLFDEHRDCGKEWLYFEVTDPQTGKRKLTGCYVVSPQGVVYVKDSAGDTGAMPLEWFEPIKTI